MTKNDLINIRELLLRIKDPDGYSKVALAAVEKDIARFEKCKGQIKEKYEVHNFRP